VYDGDGNRVEKTGSKIYWYAGGEILDETDTTGSTTNSSFNEYYFFGANRIARRDSSSNVFYYLADHLDSSRVIAEVPSGQTTATLCYDADFEPYGGEHTYTNTCPQNYKFTSKERDTESGLDNFGARFYASTTGRFMSPDWALRPTAVPYAKFGDPQTLNLYTYVENSPLNRIDADGHEDKRLNLGDGVSTQGPETGPSTCNGGNNNCPAAQSTTVASFSQQTTTKDANGNTVTVTTTINVTFGSGKDNAGAFLGADREVNTRVTAPDGSPANVAGGNDNTTLTNISQKEAVNAVGARAFTDAQQSAVPSYGAQFGRAVASDFHDHPGKYAFAVVETLAIFTPLPEALAAIEGIHEVKASIDAGVAAGDLTWETLNAMIGR